MTTENPYILKKPRVNGSVIAVERQDKITALTKFTEVPSHLKIEGMDILLACVRNTKPRDTSLPSSI